MDGCGTGGAVEEAGGFEGAGTSRSAPSLAKKSSMACWTSPSVKLRYCRAFSGCVPVMEANCASAPSSIPGSSGLWKVQDGYGDRVRSINAE